MFLFQDKKKQLPESPEIPKPSGSLQQGNSLLFPYTIIFVYTLLRPLPARRFAITHKTMVITKSGRVFPTGVFTVISQR